MITVAIVGRPNVGKSTLFNKLVGKRVAITHDEPGVTRDAIEAVTEIGDMSFRFVDTAGLDETDKTPLQSTLLKATEAIIQDADYCLFVVDSREGVHPLDEAVAKLLRRKGIPMSLVINKCERQDSVQQSSEFFALGIEPILCISAEHGYGVEGLYQTLTSIENVESVPEIEDENTPISIAIIGRPNAGKSTLCNALLGENRMVTDAEAGTTRDAIHIPFTLADGHKAELVDTAGVRKRSNVTETLEQQAVRQSFEAIRFCHVAVLLCDASQPLERQDIKLAETVVEEGRCLIVGINKNDQVTDKEALKEHVSDMLSKHLSQLPHVPVIYLSALRKRGMERLQEAIIQVYQDWNRRVNTSQLNRWLEVALENHSPPMVHGKRISLNFISQTRTRPPAFTISANHPSLIPGSYKRYLMHHLRDHFNWQEVPIRLHFRKKKNPYMDH